MKYYLYILSCPVYADQDICKIGCTTDPHSRLQTYFTSYPPNLLPYDIHYYAIWEIDAEDEADMKYKEGIIHDEFYSGRKRRDVSSEWFEIKDFLATISNFIESCEFSKQQVKLEDVPRKKKSPLETVSYPKNRKLFIRDTIKKNDKLDQIQFPAIKSLTDFLTGNEVAGQLIAPCGSGKTNMVCRSLQTLNRVIICVPSRRIQEQWHTTLGKECLFVGGDSDNWNLISSSLQSEKFCIITTYASCKKLVDVLPNKLDVIVFDEAHHMTGLVSDDKEKGMGITRVLLKTVADKGIKRLFLTFTPKDVDSEDSGFTVMSMNDEYIFGKVLYEIKLRYLIQQGVLPDYNIWALSSEGIGLQAKMEQILLAWNSNQIHHLIVFVKEKSDKAIVKNYLLQQECQAEVFTIESQEESTSIIEKFTKSQRAILVDCRRLGEGVDIPVADSVAILYAKESIVEVVQMVLRAGRWYKDKSIFHILLPHALDEDMSGIQNVLYCLAKYDEALRGELLLTTPSKSTGNGVSVSNLGISNDHIQYEILTSHDYERMKECFQNIQAKLVHKLNKKDIQKLCIQRKIITSKDYDELRKELIHLPEDPRFSGITWFDYLNLNIQKISYEEFRKTTDKQSATEYAAWQPETGYPSLQNIRDGYFGEDKRNFQEYESSESERRRR
jgi:superfamily II DNA or RNA helicase